MKNGSTGWYDSVRQVAIFQKNSYSSTAYSMPYDTFLRMLA